MPAEWEPHEATWLSWPANNITWPGGMLFQVRDIYFQMLAALLPGEKVNLLVRDAVQEEEVLDGLKKQGIEGHELILHKIPTVDAWIRDYGPTFLKDKSGSKAWCKWIFNAWGSKYDDLMQDTHVFERSDLVPYPCFKPGFVMEGGSMEVNGEGICLVTEQCLLNSNRNPQFSKPDIEQNLRDYLGVHKIVWVREGIVGDDTDGHIDDIVRFTGPQTVVSAYEENPADANYAILKENWKFLHRADRENGFGWNLVQLPMPGKLEREGEPLPASYANFYIANGVVLLPVFGHKNDDRAIKIITELFSGRTIVPIRAEALVYGFGAIHCVSQQEPV